MIILIPGKHIKNHPSVKLAIHLLGVLADNGYAAAGSVEEAVDSAETAALIEAFLAGETAENRWLFVRRYWYLDAIRDIAEKTDASEGSVKTSLSRSRAALKEKLEKEGYSI